MTKECLGRSNATELFATSGMDCVIENHLSLRFRQVVAEQTKERRRNFHDDVQYRSDSYIRTIIVAEVDLIEGQDSKLRIISD